MFDYDVLKKYYPEILSSEQLRKILHISKRKCVWMLQNGWIPCKDNHQKTRRYTIRLDDVIAYLKDEELHPEKYIFPPIFSSGKPKPKLERLQPLSSEKSKKFRKQLSEEWKKYDDILKIKDVVGITGYSEYIVCKWMRQKQLRFIETQAGIITCKAWLIDFYCADGYLISKKSPEHILVLETLFQSGTG